MMAELQGPRAGLLLELEAVELGAILRLEGLVGQGQEDTGVLEEGPEMEEMDPVSRDIMEGLAEHLQMMVDRAEQVERTMETKMDRTEAKELTLMLLMVPVAVAEVVLTRILDMAGMVLYMVVVEEMDKPMRQQETEQVRKE